MTAAFTIHFKKPNLTANFPQQAQELEPCLAESSQPSSLVTALAQQLLDRKLVAAPQNIYWSGITSTIEHDLKRLERVMNFRASL